MLSRICLILKLGTTRLNFRTKYLKTIIYADDTTFIADLDNIPKNEQERKINSELQIINLWLKSNKLSLNCKKSKFIVFYQPPGKTVIPELLIDNEKICCVDELIFLGLTITKHLSWKKHIDKISNKISKIIGVLNKSYQISFYLYTIC